MTQIRTSLTGGKYKIIKNSFIFLEIIMYRIFYEKLASFVTQ
jgi:hypothetical protein